MFSVLMSRKCYRPVCAVFTTILFGLVSTQSFGQWKKELSTVSDVSAGSQNEVWAIHYGNKKIYRKYGNGQFTAFSDLKEGSGEISVGKDGAVYVSVPVSHNGKTTMEYRQLNSQNCGGNPNACWTTLYRGAVGGRDQIICCEIEVSPSVDSRPASSQAFGSIFAHDGAQLFRFTGYSGIPWSLDPTSGWVRDLDMKGPNEPLVVTEFNEILLKQDNQWERLYTGSSMKAAINSQGELWNISREGLASRYNGNGNWTPQANGINAREISVGKRGSVWLIDTKNDLYKWEKENSFDVIGGRLSQISVGFGGETWGVNDSGNIYKRVGSNWTHINYGIYGLLKFKHVSVGNNGVVWAVDTGNRVWRYNGNNTWSAGGPSNGRLVKVDIGPNGQVWGINQGGNIYQLLNGNWVHRNRKPWSSFNPENFIDVAVGNNLVLGIGRLDANSTAVFKYENGQWSRLETYENLVAQLDISVDGEVWGTTQAGRPVRYNGLGSWSTYKDLSTNTKYISAGKRGQVWTIDSQNKIYALN